MIWVEKENWVPHYGGKVEETLEEKICWPHSKPMRNPIIQCCCIFHFAVFFLSCISHNYIINSYVSMKIKYVWDLLLFSFWSYTYHNLLEGSNHFIRRCISIILYIGSSALFVLPSLHLVVHRMGYQADSNTIHLVVHRMGYQVGLTNFNQEAFGFLGLMMTTNNLLLIQLIPLMMIATAWMKRRNPCLSIDLKKGKTKQT